MLSDDDVRLISELIRITEGALAPSVCQRAIVRWIVNYLGQHSLFSVAQFADFFELHPQLQPQPQLHPQLHLLLIKYLIKAAIASTSATFSNKHIAKALRGIDPFIISYIIRLLYFTC